jgi:endonuclease/exonuclease/phosphatase family metal-dependent hydrolase
VSGLLSIRDAAKYAVNPLQSSFSLRKILKHEIDNIQLRARTIPAFSVISQNTALLDPITYKGTDRYGAILELVNQIRNESADVVGLCEVWCDNPLCNGDDKFLIRSLLADMYGQSVQGPPESPKIPIPVIVPTPFGPITVVVMKSAKENGGLLVLSKHPILEYHVLTYENSVLPDWLVNKGAIHISIHPQDSLTSWDIYFSHMQDIEPSGGRDALYSQLSQLNKFVKDTSNPSTPTLIMGDLNIPGEVGGDYTELISRLRNPVDLWVTKNPGSSGFTQSTNNNFSDSPVSHDSRLDYILLISGRSFVPVPSNVEILKFMHNGCAISDHFGLKAKFGEGIQIVE